MVLLYLSSELVSLACRSTYPLAPPDFEAYVLSKPPKHSIEKKLHQVPKTKILSKSAPNQSSPSSPNKPVRKNQPPAPKPSTPQPHNPSTPTQQHSRPSNHPTPSTPKPYNANPLPSTKTPPHSTSPLKPTNPSPPKPDQTPCTTAATSSKKPAPPCSGRIKSPHPSATHNDPVKGLPTRVERAVAAEVARRALGGVWRVGETG